MGDSLTKNLELLPTVERDILGEKGVIPTGMKLGGEVIQSAESGIVRALEGGLTTFNNIADIGAHTIKFTGKNLLGVVDSGIDNLIQFGQDIRADVVDIIQLSLILGGTGLIVVLILHGDTLVKQGLSFGEIKLL